MSEDLVIGSRIPLNGEMFDVREIEQCRIVRTAMSSSEAYERLLYDRQINRYMQLEIEEHERGDLITEKWVCLRVRSKTRTWNVYTEYTVKKGEVE